MAAVAGADFYRSFFSLGFLFFSLDFEELCDLNLHRMND